MTILDYNRIVIGLNGYSKEDLLSNINKKFLIEKKDKPYKPRKKNEFGMFLDNAWYQLNLRENLNKKEVIYFSFFNEVVKYLSGFFQYGSEVIS